MGHSSEAKSSAGLIVWTIHRHPSDFPDKYVARAYVVSAGKVQPSATYNVRDTHEAARASLPQGLINLGRMPEDTSTIVETWA